jgi:hypothetical protein
MLKESIACKIDTRAEIHKALLSQFSLVGELFIGKFAVKD